MELDEIKVASAYGKKNIENFINSSRLLYLNDDKEKITRWIQCTRVQFPFGVSSNDSVQETYSNVELHMSNDSGSSMISIPQYEEKAREIPEKIIFFKEKIWFVVKLMRQELITHPHSFLFYIVGAVNIRVKMS